MPTDSTRELTFVESVEEDTDDYTTLLDSEELVAEMADDPTIAKVTGVPKLPPGKRGPKLDEHQQMTVAVWIVEGLSWKKAVPIMEAKWGFSITERAWRYYQQFRKDLIGVASSRLEDSYLRSGFAHRAVRVRKLASHLDRLERYMREHGLEEKDSHLIGYHKGTAEVAETTKFASALSKEYVRALDQMDKWLVPTERSIKGAQTPQIDSETANAFLLAAGWEPGTKKEEE